MGRKPTGVVSVDGSLDVRVTLPREIVLVLQQIVVDLGLPPDDVRPAFNLLTRHIAGLWNKGQADYFGPVFMDALRRVREQNLGAISAGPPIDLSRLHRSNKTKSGFVGVYANGKGFRAMARVKGVETYIGQFDTAEEAAWKRRLFYLDHKLPYGELEDAMTMVRKMPGMHGAPENVVLDNAVGMMQDSGMLDTILPDLRDIGYELEGHDAPQPIVRTQAKLAQPSQDEDPSEPGLLGFSDDRARTLLR